MSNEQNVIFAILWFIVLLKHFFYFFLQTDIPGCRPDKLTFVFPESFLEIIFEIVVGKVCYEGVLCQISFNDN